MLPWTTDESSPSTACVFKAGLESSQEVIRTTGSVSGRNDLEVIWGGFKRLVGGGHRPLTAFRKALR